MGSSSRTPLAQEWRDQQELPFQLGAPETDPKGWSNILLQRFDPGERRPLADILQDLDRKDGDPLKRWLYTANTAGITMAFALCKLLQPFRAAWLSYLGSREQWKGHGKFLMVRLIAYLRRHVPDCEILVWSMKSPREPRINEAEQESRLSRQRFHDNLPVQPPTQRPPESVEFWLPNASVQPYKAELRWILLHPTADVNVPDLGRYILTQVYSCAPGDPLVLRFLASCRE